MKLIDILVQELPKLGGWPDKADFAVQNYRDGGIKFGKNPIEVAISEKWNNELWQGEWHFSNQYDFICHEVASDCREVIISRGDYAAALAASKELIINKPDSDGWIYWCGGECPVDGDEVVDVKFRAQGQADLDGDVADNFRWEHFSNGADVVAYRLHKSEHQKPQWDGEGLPPVGCECEYNTRVHEMKHVGGGTYKALDDPIILNVRIVFVHGDQIAAIYTHNNKLITIDGSKYLRPTRSQTDKKRDEATHAMASAPKPCGHDIYGICCEIYDAIAAGKIPGIRVE